MDSEHAWQREVSQTLGSVLQGVHDLTEQLKRLNGNVGELWQAHDAIVERVAKLETQQAVDRASDEAAEEANKTWTNALKPLAKFVLTGVGYAVVFIVLWAIGGKDLVVKAIGK